MKHTAHLPRHLLTGLCLTALLAPLPALQAGLASTNPARHAASADASANPQNASAFLRVVLPKDALTVGELVPVKVEAWFRAGVSASLNGLPLLSSDAFTLNKLNDHPDQERRALRGVPYTVVTWTTALSAVKAGDYPLNVDLPVMVRVQERSQRRGGGRDPFRDFFGEDSPFSDSFFDNFFAQTAEKPLTLHTEGQSIHIEPLPMQGRPAGFTGAVGQFQIAGEIPAANATSGDPLTLKLSITGQGNFDRVTTAGLPGSAAWKTYPPSAHFEPGDASGISGTKTFTQAVVPAQAGAQQVPAVAFSYFDPEAKQYVTTQTAPLAISVAPGAPVIAAAPAAASPSAPVPPRPADDLAPDQTLTGSGPASLRPLFLAPWFLVLNAVMAAALLAGGIFRAVGFRRARDPERLRRVAAERATREALAALSAAQTAQDAPRFFAVAREALRQRLALRWGLPPARVTIPEIQARLNGHGEELRDLFRTADELAYSGRRFSAPDLGQWRQIVENQLQQISHS